MEESKSARKPALRAMCEAIKARLDYRQFYLRFCREERLTMSGGARLQTRCPIPAHAHSGKGQPSFSIDFARGLFHCFSRDEGGDAIRFYELMHNVSFARAVHCMARELGLHPETHDSRQFSLAFRAAPDAETVEQVGAPATLDTEQMRRVCEKFLEVCREEDQAEAINYLARRGIDRETMRRAGISYFPRRSYRRVMRRMQEAFALLELQQSGLFNARAHLTFYRHRLLFPFYVEKRAVYLQARTTAAGVEPRWHNLRGGVPALYNVDALNDLASGAIVYLVEGFTDTLTLAAHNFAAVGLVGAGGLKEEWIASLARFQVVAALDPDVAGERAAVRCKQMFARRGLRLACLKLSSDVNEFFRHRPSAAIEFALLTEAALDELETDVATKDTSEYN